MLRGGWVDLASVRTAQALPPAHSLDPFYIGSILREHIPGMAGRVLLSHGQIGPPREQETQGKPQPKDHRLRRREGEE